MAISQHNKLNMEIALVRLQESDDATLGVMYTGTEFVCYTLEDEHREEKIKGETRIPEGEYEIKFREVISPATERYRAKFDWFTYHIELQDVPNFKYVYVHIGNDDDDSDGCILVGSQADSKNYKIWESTKAFKKLYLAVSRELRGNNKVTIKIINTK